MVFILDIVINVGLLWYFKYYDTFAGTINTLLHRTVLEVRNIVLPIGISFYTFQILSYCIDVYKKKCDVQKNFIDFALYVSLFPQLIAGPIVKYRDVAYQLQTRQINSTQTAVGIKRFIYGLSKKVIFSNTIAEVADTIFSVSYDVIDTKWLWVGTFYIHFRFIMIFRDIQIWQLDWARCLGLNF
jgi:alginate O-acetyltransferase complex protein AlgI